MAKYRVKCGFNIATPESKRELDPSKRHKMEPRFEADTETDKIPAEYVQRLLDQGLIEAV